MNAKFNGGFSVRMPIHLHVRNCVPNDRTSGFLQQSLASYPEAKPAAGEAAPTAPEPTATAPTAAEPSTAGGKVVVEAPVASEAKAKDSGDSDSPTHLPDRNLQGRKCGRNI